MIESEFIIWKVESLEAIKESNPNLTREESLSQLRIVAEKIAKTYPMFFGNYDFRRGLSK